MKALSFSKIHGSAYVFIDDFVRKIFIDDISVGTIFFSIWVFFHEHSRITGLQGKMEGIFLKFLTTTSTRFTGT